MQNSLVFMNSDSLVDFPRPSAARIIDIGGITVSNGARKLNTVRMSFNERLYVVSNHEVDYGIQYSDSSRHGLP